MLSGNQHHCVDNFTFESISLWSYLSLEESAQDCLLAEDLVCDQITPACYGRLGEDTTVSCEGKIQVGVSLLPLIYWQGSEGGNKGISAEIPEPEAATPRRPDSTALDLSCHSKDS